MNKRQRVCGVANCAGGIAVVDMRCLIYNVCSAVRVGRMQMIAQEANCDLCLLTGTRWRSPRDQSYHLVKLHKHWAISFGWKPGPFTNSSAGCAIILGKRFKPWHVAEVRAPPAGLQGRAGAIRLRSTGFDLTVAVCYAPPLTESGNKRAAQVKGGRLAVDWNRPPRWCGRPRIDRHPWLVATSTLGLGSLTA